MSVNFVHTCVIQSSRIKMNFGAVVFMISVFAVTCAEGKSVYACLR